MGAYRLYTVVPRLTAFIADLTNVYVRYNRTRLKGGLCGEEGGEGGDKAGAGGAGPPDDQRAALSTLHAVLATLARVMAPFTPFFCEALWRNLRRAAPAGADAASWPESVHWADFPEPGPPAAGDEAVRAGVGLMQAAIELARGVRDKHALPLKQPLRSLTLIHRDPAALGGLTPDLRAYIASEANVGAVDLSSDVGAWTAGRAVPDWAALGVRLGPAMGSVAAGLKAADDAMLAAIEAGEPVTVAGVELGPGDVSVARTFVRPKAGTGGGGGDGKEGASAPASSSSPPLPTARATPPPASSSPWTWPSMRTWPPRARRARWRAGCRRRARRPGWWRGSRSRCGWAGATPRPLPSRPPWRPPWRRRRAGWRPPWAGRLAPWPTCRPGGRSWCGRHTPRGRATSCWC